MKIPYVDHLKNYRQPLLSSGDESEIKDLIMDIIRIPEEMRVHLLHPILVREVGMLRRCMNYKLMPIERLSVPYFTNSVAISPDSKFIVSGSGDKVINVWNASTRKLVKVLQGHTRDVLSVAVSPDGRFIVSGSKDKTVCIWNAFTGEQVMVLKDKDFRDYHYSFNSVAISPDGNFIASASDIVQIWNTSDGEKIRDLKVKIRGSGYFPSVAFSPDGKFIVSGLAGEGTRIKDKIIYIWDASTGELVKELIGHVEDVYSVAVSPDGKFIVSGSSDNTVRIWNASTGEQMNVLPGKPPVAVSPDGKFIVSGSVDFRTIHIWDFYTGKQVMVLEGHTSRVASLAISPDGKFIVSKSIDDTMRIWDIELMKIKDGLEELFKKIEQSKTAVGSAYTLLLLLLGQYFRHFGSMRSLSELEEMLRRQFAEELRANRDSDLDWLLSLENNFNRLPSELQTIVRLCYGVPKSTPALPSRVTRVSYGMHTPHIPWCYK